MENEDNVIQVLNDLLKINNDRVEGYDKAAEEVDEFDLKTIFRSMADDSTKNASKLTLEIMKLGGDAKIGSTTTSGKIYRIWMEVKSTLTNNDTQSVLNACEFGEDAAQTAYKEALKHDELTDSIRLLITDQQLSLKASHDTIKRYRDSELQTKQFN